MNDKIIYIALLLFICCLSAISQVLLKKASQCDYKSYIRQYLNPYTVIGYGFFFLVLVMNIFILRHLPIVICSVFAESLPLIFSIFTGRIFFSETIKKEKIIGVIIIIAGITVIMI